jgi:CheY-like chemotaxis protein
MDIRMLGLDGIEATRHLLANGSSAPRVLTTFDLNEYLYAPSLLRRLVEDFVRRRAPGSRTPAEVTDLTERELEGLEAGRPRPLERRDRDDALPQRRHERTYVRHIFSKLNLRDRVQAVVVAYECGLAETGEV